MEHKSEKKGRVLGQNVKQRQDPKLSADFNFKTLAKDLMDSNQKQFSFMMSSKADSINQRKIERVYSKNEIRQMVTSHLIDEYQNQRIIDAVTDYLYGVHMTL